MNTIKVLIDGVDYSKKAVAPYKWADLLDEQLDEAHITLKNLKVEKSFRPLTEVEITITNSPESKQLGVKNTKNTAISQFYDTESKRLTQSTTKVFLVALDTVFNYPVGTDLYSHEIYLIERTKLLEGYIGDSITFTNALGNDYASASGDALFFRSTGTDSNTPFYSNYYRQPSGVGEFTLCNIKTFCESIGITADDNPNKWVQVLDEHGNVVYKCESKIIGTTTKTITITETVGNSSSVVWTKSGSVDDVKAEFMKTNYVVSNGTKTIKIDLPEIYKIAYNNTFIANDGTTASYTTFESSISFVVNRLPLKRWTISDVIKRLFDVIRPIRVKATETGELGDITLTQIVEDLPKFILEGTTHEKLEKILAPEFAFTKMNLREQLKQVGGFIHGEPRIIGKNERNQYIVDFDWYGGEEYATLNDMRCISSKSTHDINNFATSLDSETDNLISQLNWAQGVIVEPFVDGSKTLRTELTSARISDVEGTIISTECAINSIGGNAKVYCTNIPDYPDYTTHGRKVDITPYIFEKADYDNLSSYDNVFPRSKACALYYTQGQKGIHGLFFKIPNATDSSLEKYSIVNILRQATGDSSINIDSTKYPYLSFTVSYTPIFYSRVKTNKSLVLGGKPFDLAYNQSANYVASDYFGQNLKGAIARLGNAEKQKTYKVAFLSDIPKAGQKIKEIDGDYYISAVSVEMMPDYFKITVGLTKNFNRISEYVGINSEKRMWEVSEKSAYQRSRVFTDYLLISETETENTSNSILHDTILIKNFLNINSTINTLDTALCTQFSKQGLQVGKTIAMPVVSTALGNSLLFTFKLQDNYSAGQKTVEYDVDNVTGVWGEYVPYCDYYGRYYYWKVKYFYEGHTDLLSTSQLPEVPSYTKIEEDRSFAKYLTKYRKDNREVPTETYEISLVTDSPKIVIGSAMASNCKLVNRDPVNILCVGLSKKLNFLDRQINQSDIVATLDFTAIQNTLTVEVPEGVKSWAFITEHNTVLINVEDEDGVETIQTIERGGELVLGQNVETAGAHTLYFSIKDKVYED